MEHGKDLNSALKEEVNKIFADLFREIGNNRVQLSTQIFNIQHEINKELNKDKVDEARKQEILKEVARAEKMAAKQLPHLLKKNPAKPASFVPVAKPKSAEKPRSEKAAVAKPSAPEKSKPAPPPKVIAKSDAAGKKAKPAPKNAPLKKKKK